MLEGAGIKEHKPYFADVSGLLQRFGSAAHGDSSGVLDRIPILPVEIAGKAMELSCNSSAIRMDSRWQLASVSASPCLPPLQNGPTVWITCFAASRPAGVATACPAGSRPMRATISLQASRMAGPPARWMAPSTPPPPSSEEFAALTMASVCSRVMSPGPAMTRTRSSSAILTTLPELDIRRNDNAAQSVSKRQPVQLYRHRIFCSCL